MGELERPFGGPADWAEGSNSESTPERAAYEPPRLRALGTLAELTRGVATRSDGIGPGSAVGPTQPPGAP